LFAYLRPTLMWNNPNNHKLLKNKRCFAYTFSSGYKLVRY